MAEKGLNKVRARALRIAFLSRFQGSVERGVETFVYELSERLSKNHEVIILSGKNADDFQKLVSGNFDIVIPVNGRLQSLKSSFGRLFSKYKLVISGQSGTGIDDIFNVLIKPDAFVALTHFAAFGETNKLRRATTWSWGTKVVTIPNGVDLDRFTPNGPRENFDLEKPMILSVGALFWYKHHEETIRVLADFGRGSLLIIGQGPEKQRLQDLGESLLGKGRFKVLQVPFEEVPRYYRSANLFVLPSWNREAFGTVYVEAMASGLAVVAPDDPPRREIVGDAGILTDVTDPRKYADAIKEALFRDWGNVPRKQAEKFSWDIIAKQYEDLIKELMR